MHDHADERQARYTRMDRGTVEDYALLKELRRPFEDATVDRVLAHLELLRDSYPGNRIDRYQHSLQTATRAEDAGECDEIVVAGLLHDIGDTISLYNHEEIGAQVLRPYVSQYTCWMLRQHGIFQGYYYFDKIGRNKDEREQFRGHPAFEMTERFCRDYDQVSFDPDYETRPVEHFVPRMRAIFGREPWGPHTRELWPVT